MEHIHTPLEWCFPCNNDGIKTISARQPFFFLKKKHINIIKLFIVGGRPLKEGGVVFQVIARPSKLVQTPALLLQG